MLYYYKKLITLYFYNFTINTMMEKVCELVPMNTTPEAEITRLATCNCCSAHKNNKPSSLGPWIELEMDHAAPHITNKDENGIIKCTCDCRHKARFICRKYYIA